MQPDLVDQVLFDEFETEVQRKRTTSVSKMDRKDSAAPEEEEEEERPPMVNGLAGESPHCWFLSLDLIITTAPYWFFFFFLALFICFCPTDHFIILRMEKQQGLFFPPFPSFFSPNKHSLN